MMADLTEENRKQTIGSRPYAALGCGIWDIVHTPPHTTGIKGQVVDWVIVGKRGGGRWGGGGAYERAYE